MQPKIIPTDGVPALPPARIGALRRPRPMQASVRAAALALALASNAHAALDVRELDGKADPCRDFYGYVNGSWLAGTTIPDDRSGWGTFAIVAKRNEAILLSALDEALAAPPAEGSAAR